MKVAILIVGHLRTWTICKNNFFECFASINPDVFVSTYDLQYNYHPAMRRWMGGHPDTLMTRDEIITTFNDVNVIKFDIEKIEDVINEYYNMQGRLHPNFREEEHTVLQYRKITRAANLMLEHENQTNQRYDIILKIRPDICHKKFDINISNNNVIVSTKNVFPNDVLIASNRNDFINLFNFINREFYNQIYNDSHLRAPHNLLLAACNYNNFDIVKMDIMDYVVRKIGKNYYEDLN